MAPYLEVRWEDGRDFVARGMTGPVTMLNLLRFRPQADYGAAPHLPPQPITGAEAYDRYIVHSAPFLKASGGEILFMGEGGPWLIGPGAERWDRIMLVRQRSVDAFLAHAENAAYLAGVGHRTAAIADSRLLPIMETGLPQH
ncbi:MAG TPA: DUF1330 domain-containing protein [Sphingobium sp.]|uniref:DUF1330 domain-containing protein n=1 Tax=Sphingobium sp. TaxID=1912891 RepID=UPI002ED2709A